MSRRHRHRHSPETKAWHAAYIERNPLPPNACDWTYSAASRIYAKIGVQNATIPRNFRGTFNVDGWTIVVKPGWHPPLVAERGTGKHRVFVKAPDSGRLVPMGRVKQALCPITVDRSRSKATARRGAGGRFTSR